ncbi:MAG: hypothetical protein WBL28_04245 [Methylotenera sp.]
MAQIDNKSAEQAKRDVQFLKEHPVEGAAVLTGATLTGAANAVKNAKDEAVAFADKLTVPGDMNIKNAPHPADAIKAGMAHLTSPGDMNLDHSPHPVDNKLAAASKKLEKIKTAGPIQGALMGAEMVTAGIIDNLNPGKKIKVAGDVLEEAADASKAIKVTEKARHVEGELVDAADISNGKGLAVPTNIVESNNPLIKAKNKILDTVEKVPMFGEVLAPDLGQRIINQAHKENHSLLGAMDEKHRIGGDVDAYYAQLDDKLERAKVLAKMASENPEQARILNRSYSNKQISELINNTNNEQLGLPHNPNSVPKLPSPEEQVSINAQLEKLEAGKKALADELALQDSLPFVQRMLRKAYMNNIDTTGKWTGPQMYGDTKMLDLRMNATDSGSEKRMLVLQKNVRGIVQLGAFVGVPVLAVTHDWRSNEEKNHALAESFLHGVKTSPFELKYTAITHKELKNAVDQYNVVINQLAKGGNLSEQDNHALNMVAIKFAKQIEEQGPESFGAVTKGNEQLQNAEHVVTPK